METLIFHFHDSKKKVLEIPMWDGAKYEIKGLLKRKWKFWVETIYVLMCFLNDPYLQAFLKKFCIRKLCRERNIINLLSFSIVWHCLCVGGGIYAFISNKILGKLWQRENKFVSRVSTFRTASDEKEIYTEVTTHVHVSEGTRVILN